jgi:hypothetical protein
MGLVRSPRNHDSFHRTLAGVKMSGGNAEGNEFPREGRSAEEIGTFYGNAGRENIKGIFEGRCSRNFEVLFKEQERGWGVLMLEMLLSDSE